MKEITNEEIASAQILAKSIRVTHVGELHEMSMDAFSIACGYKHQTSIQIVWSAINFRIKKFNKKSHYIKSRLEKIRDILRNCLTELGAV